MNNMSIGEEKIKTILSKNNIVFSQEKNFNDLKGGAFRYDFYLPNYNNRQVIIEFNGEQHYKFIKHFHKNRLGFLKNQEHDRRKISYCLANNIDIYIIPFWEIDKINVPSDLFQNQYRATTRWHNDKIYQKK